MDAGMTEKKRIRLRDRGPTWLIVTVTVVSFLLWLWLMEGVPGGLFSGYRG